MSITDELLRNNEGYAKSFDKGGLPLPPAKRSASSRTTPWESDDEVREEGGWIGACPASRDHTMRHALHREVCVLSSTTKARSRTSAALGFQGEVCSKGL